MTERRMYERVFGSKYEETKHLGHNYAAIAKLIRADIKEAIRLGMLPGTTADYSVRSDSYSMGGSIEVTILRPDFWETCTGIIPGSEDGLTARSCGNQWCVGHGGTEEHKVLSVEGQNVKKLVEWLHRRYNYDGSDTMTDYFDVRYYGIVQVEDERGMEFRLQEKARLAKNKEQAAAKKAVIAKIVALAPYKPGRLRLLSLERLEALLAQLEGNS